MADRIDPDDDAIASHLKDFDIFMKAEDLDPELEARITITGDWVSIKHPLVFSIMYVPQMNCMLNLQLAQKKKALNQAWVTRDWHSVVWLHERPYRIEAFQSVKDELTDAEYWSLLADVWIDSENIREFPDEWEELLMSQRAGREHFMSERDAAALAALPDEITVYQGHTLDRDDGWSWTTEESTAIWFARRFAALEQSLPVVTVATVTKADVLGYLLSRNEYEIVVQPDLVREVRSYTTEELTLDEENH